MSKKRRRPQQKKRTPQKKKQQGGLRLAIIVALIIVAAVVTVQLVGNRNDNVIQAGPAYYEGLPFNGTTLGDPAAPVTVIEYFDFQCPACHQSSDLIVKPLIEQYVAAGEVQFIYRFFPILGPESVASAEAAYCAMQQDAFWPYQDALMSRKASGNRGAFSQRNLNNFAKQLGLDEQKFAECLTGDAAKAYVSASYDHAVGIGLGGTPTFFVNGQHMSNSWTQIQRAVEEALADAGFRD